MLCDNHEQSRFSAIKYQNAGTEVWSSSKNKHFTGHEQKEMEKIAQSQI